MKRIAIIIAALALFSACSDSSSGLYDGYYSAEAEEFGKTGWKEYVTIYVSNNKIVTVEYDAKNASGFIKSWDMDYMRNMNASDGTYPNEYTRIYANALVNRQDPALVDAVSGATHSHTDFQLIAQAAINQARIGDTGIAYVPLG